MKPRKLTAHQSKELARFTSLWARAPAGVPIRTLKALLKRGLIHQRLVPGVHRNEKIAKFPLNVFPHEWRMAPSFRMHRLATWPPYYHEIVHKRKTFEIRKDDRDFRIDDVLELYEFDPEEGVATGRELRVAVKSILRPVADFGLKPGFVAMSLGEPWFDFVMDLPPSAGGRKHNDPPQG